MADNAPDKIDLSDTLKTLTESLGTALASWSEVLTKTAQSKNITVAEWNTIVIYASTTFKDVQKLQCAISDVVKAIGTGTVGIPDASNVLEALKVIKDWYDSILESLNNLSTRLGAFENESAGKFVNQKSDPTIVYATDAAGTQTSLPYSVDASANSLVRRDSAGRIKSASPVDTSHAATKGYVDSKFVPAISDQRDVVYAHSPSKGYYGVPFHVGSFPDSIPIRDENGTFMVPNPTSERDAISLSAIIEHMELYVDSSTYVLDLRVKRFDGTYFSLGQVDLPLESVVVSGAYDNTNKQLVLTLHNDSTISIDVHDLISGLANSNDVYTKDKVYTKDEVYRKDEVYTKEEVYSKSYVDANFVSNSSMATVDEALENLTITVSEHDQDLGGLRDELWTLESNVEKLESRIDYISPDGCFYFPGDNYVHNISYLYDAYPPEFDEATGHYKFNGELWCVTEAGTYEDEHGDIHSHPANAMFALNILSGKWYPLGGDGASVDTSTLVTKDEFNDTVGDLSTILEMLNEGGIV